MSYKAPSKFSSTGSKRKRPRPEDSTTKVSFASDDDSEESQSDGSSDPGSPTSSLPEVLERALTTLEKQIAMWLDRGTSPALLARLLDQTFDQLLGAENPDKPSSFEAPPAAEKPPSSASSPSTQESRFTQFLAEGKTRPAGGSAPTRGSR